MTKNFEVELRGPISKTKITELVKLFRKEGRFKARKDRVLVCFFKAKNKKEFREGIVDLRVRSTNGDLEIVLKMGKWGGSEHREEFRLTLHPGQFDAALVLFAQLGFDEGIWAIRRGEVYDYKGIEFSLVEVPNHSYYFEAEKMVNKKTDIAQAKKTITALCAKLGLALFDDAGFQRYVDSMNRESNGKYHFKRYKPGFFKKTFGV